MEKESLSFAFTFHFSFAFSLLLFTAFLYFLKFYNFFFFAQESPVTFIAFKEFFVPLWVSENGSFLNMETTEFSVCHICSLFS